MHKKAWTVERSDGPETMVAQLGLFEIAIVLAKNWKEQRQINDYNWCKGESHLMGCSKTTAL